jgi:protease IV
MAFWSSQKESIDPNDPHRDWQLTQQLLKDAFAEQKKARRWGVVFKTLTFSYLFILLAVAVMGSRSLPGGHSSSSHTAVVRVEGVIAADKPASAARITQGLRNAFEQPNAKAVIVAINSPGGSPVQAGIIYDEMQRLQQLHPDKPLYAVIADIGASGGYYIAAAARSIYADKASLVGSIGVTASSFGFVDILQKLGVERRHFTAGEHKAFLDPFSPLKTEEVAFWNSVLSTTHQQFINAVKAGRKERLTVTDEITSGLIWTGEQALKLGLVDGLASVRVLARETVKEEELVDYTPQDSPLEQLAHKFGVSFGRGMATQLIESAQQPTLGY